MLPVEVLGKHQAARPDDLLENAKMPLRITPGRRFVSGGGGSDCGFGLAQAFVPLGAQVFDQ
jgi:hypothetical protein